MKKIDILNRMNLTLLAQAYMDGLIPKAKKGEIYFSKDYTTGEITYIYFNNSYYENILFKEINNSIFLGKINSSNASSNWNALRNALNNSIEINNLDLSKVELYPLVNEIEEPISYSEEILKNVLQTKDNNTEIGNWKKIENDIKRIFPSLGIDVFRQDDMLRVAFNIPIILENEQRFIFKPIFLIISKNDMKVTDLKLYKGENKNFIRVSVFFDKL